GFADRAPIHLYAERDEPGAIVVARANHDLGPLVRALERNLGHLRGDGLAELGTKTGPLGGLAREWRSGRRRRGRSLLGLRRRAPALLPFELAAQTAVPGRRRWRVERLRPRRGIPALGKDRDANDPHLARVAGRRRVRLGHGRKAECRRLLLREAPAVDVHAAPSRHEIAAPLAPVGGLAVDDVAPVHGDDGLDAPPAVVDDAERVPLAEVAEHERIAV